MSEGKKIQSIANHYDDHKSTQAPWQLNHHPIKRCALGQLASWHTLVGSFCTLKIFTVFIFLLFLHFSLLLWIAFAGKDASSTTDTISTLQAFVVQMPSDVQDFHISSLQGGVVMLPRRQRKENIDRGLHVVYGRKSKILAPGSKNHHNSDIGLDPKNSATNFMCPRTTLCFWNSSSTCHMADFLEIRTFQRQFVVQHAGNLACRQTKFHCT